MSADASLLISSAFDQLREHPRVVPDEVPGLLERGPKYPTGETRAVYGALWLPYSR